MTTIVSTSEPRDRRPWRAPLCRVTNERCRYTSAGACADCKTSRWPAPAIGTTVLPSAALLVQI